jgi:hypothetical protein
MAGSGLNRTQQTLGVLAFVIGIGVIGIVLKIAFGMLADPKAGIPDAGGASAASAMALGSAFVRLLTRLAILLLACLCGSMVAGKGVQLLLSGDRGSRPGPTP